MSNVLEGWLQEHDEAILSRWTAMVRDRHLAHYQGLSDYELQRELLPFYECIAEAIVRDAAPAEARLEDWILGQRLYRQVQLGELLQVAALFKSAIWHDLVEGSDSYHSLQAGQRLEVLFDQATISLATLFTQAIEQTLTERLNEAEFMAQSLAAATEEADQSLQRMRMLYAVSQALSTTLDLGEVLEVAAAQAARLLPGDEAGIILFDPERGTGELVAEEPPRPDPQPAPLWFNLDQLPEFAGFGRLAHAAPLAEMQRSPLLVYLRELLTARETYPLLFIPLIARGQVIGVIYVGAFAETVSPSAEELQLAQTIANQIAVAIENAKLYQTVRDSEAILGRRVRDRTRELAQEKERVEFLYAIASETSASLDLHLILNRTLQIVTQAVGVEQGAIMLLDRETGHLVCRAAMGGGSLLELGDVIPFRLGEGFVGWVAQHREPARVGDVTQDARWLQVPGHRVSYHSYVAAPIVTGGEVQGVLSLAHPQKDYFTEDHVRLLNAVTQELGSAVHNAELYRYVQSQTERLGRLLTLQEAEASKSRSILESIADGVVFGDAEGHIVLTNAAAEEILGTPAAQLQGRNTRDLILLAEPEDRPAWLAALDMLMTSRNRGAAEASAERLTLQIANRVANVHLSPVLTGANQGSEPLFLGVVMVFRDVTRETEADRLKNEFVATVSHELRTPLTSIRGYVDLILDGDVGEVSNDVRDYLQVVKSNSNRLTDLINNLLDISHIQEGRTRFELTLVDMAALAQDTLARFRAEAEAKGLTMRVTAPAEPLVVQADGAKLAQVLDHLVSNAVKYTPAGEIEVAVHAQGNRVQLDVTDTGIGIAPPDQDKLFTRFFRAEHPVVEFAGGAGLGLSIAKAVVEAHGGAIWATSPGPAGPGSVFSLAIPRAGRAAAGEAGPDATAPALDLAQRRLLVVDDDRDIIRLLYNRLQRDGYLVDTATSGPEALRRVIETPPDLILLDILMPEMDGGTVLERLKADPRTANIPVVVLSIVDDQRRFLALGATEYLTKPFDEARLEKVISEVLGQAGRVLIADDDPDIVTLLQRVLQRRGFETLVAPDGQAALAQAHSEPPPDLILLDLRMPQLDGYQVLERLRDNPATRAIPVMIITGAAPDLAEKRQRSLALGATRFVAKPLDIETLVSEIRRLV